jgi:tetratricopeptide (TPR) repeat protein
VRGLGWSAAGSRIVALAFALAVGGGAAGAPAAAEDGAAASWRASFEEGMRAFHEARLPEARSHLERASALADSFDARDERRWRTRRALASAQQELGDRAAAEAILVPALAEQERLFGRDAPELAKTLHGLGLLRLAQGRPAEARDLLVRALALESARGGESDAATRGAILAGLGDAQRELGDLAGAERSLVEALGAFEGLGSAGAGFAARVEKRLADLRAQMRPAAGP